MDGGLRRSIGPTGAFFLTVSCLSPSIAVFIVGSDVMGQVGTAVFPCFVAAALLGLIMACVYGELGSAFPGAGGEYTIFARVFGRLAGHGIVGLNLIGFSISLALSGHGVATYLTALWPGTPPQACAAATVAVVTGVAVLNVEVGAWVTGTFLMTELVALVVVCLLGFGHAARPASALFELLAGRGDGLAAPGYAALGAAAASSIYAFNGYGAAIFFGEDMKDPARHTAPVILAALVAGVVIVMPPIAATVLGAPDLHLAFRAPATVMAVVRRLGGETVARVMSVGVALALFNTAVAIALMAGRQLYATGRDRLWPVPISRVLAATHRNWGSPGAATLVMGGFGLAGTLLPERILLLILGNSNVITYAGLCIAALWGRRSGSTEGAPWRMPAFPLPPLLGLLFLVVVAGFSLADAAGQIGFLVSVATLVISALLFSRTGSDATRGSR
ncbi:APC family permease [Sphingomonas bacterium]|uniref:APC family permease n=1 Tax=Sphingomonas bacterium TaxID=1895847 RepID=UPI0015765DAF|nr:APC family permease [Sphingomonas bacterium]